MTRVLLRVGGLAVASSLLFVVTAGLHSLGWPWPLRAIAVIPISLFWGAALVSAVEALSGGDRLQPLALGCVAVGALTLGEALVFL